MNSVWPVAGPARGIAKFRLLVGAREAAAFMPFGPGASALCRSMVPVGCGSCRFAAGPLKGTSHESWRHRAVGRTVDVVEPVAVPPVLACPLDRRVGHGRAVGMLGLGL